MTTIRSIVTQAFRENNLIPVGDSPGGAEYVEAEGLLLNFISSLFSHELGDRLTNVVSFSASDALPANSRVIVTSDTPAYTELPDLPSDGQMFGVVDPEGLLSVSNTFEVRVTSGTIQWETAATLSTGYTDATWFYRAETGNWFPVNNLTSDDESPLPSMFDDLLSLWLARRIAPRMGATTAPESIETYRRIKGMFTAKYRQVEPKAAELALLRLNSLRTHGYITDWEG